MNFFRAHSRATRGAGAIGFVFLFASLVAGCALYDAFQNPAEGGNNGNNGESCEFERDFGETTQCFSQCGSASDVAAFRGSNAACGTSEGCAIIPDGRGAPSGVCLERGGDNEFEACAFRELSDYLPETTLAAYEPCQGDGAEYQIAARPTGGYVVAGCQKLREVDSGQNAYGIRVLWLDQRGQLVDTPGESTAFYDADDLNLDGDQVPRVRSLAASDAENAILVYEQEVELENAGLRGFYGVTTFSKGSDLTQGWTPQMGIEPCSTRGPHSVSIAGKDSRWLIATCGRDTDDNLVLSTQLLTLGADGQISNSVQRFHSDTELSTSVVQDVALNGPEVDISSGSVPFRILFYDRTNTRLVSVPVRIIEDTQTGSANVEVATDLNNAVLGEAVSEPKQTGYVPTPAADHVVVSSQPRNLAATSQQGNPLRPSLYSNFSGEKTLGQEAGRPEQSLGLEVLAVSPSDLATQPTPAFEVALNWAVLSIVGVAGDQDARVGRIYGLTAALEPVWTREIGRDGEFVPQDISVSATKEVAVVGADSSGAMKLIFMDAAGRAFCDEAALQSFYERSASME